MAGYPQNKVEQLQEALKKITDSNDFKRHKKSSLIQSAIITGKLKAYKIDPNFNSGYVNVLANYDDSIKIAVIKSFKFVEASHYAEAEGNSKIKIDDLCYGDGDYLNLLPKVRAKMIEK